MAKPPVEEQSNRLANDKRGNYHKHLAIHILLTEQMDALKARMKTNLKAADQNGIPSKKLKVTHDLAKKAPSEIAKHYAEEFELLQFQGIDLGAQFNIFGGVDVQTPKKGPDFYGAGLFAALSGKDGNPPKNLKGADQQRWLEGWNDGVAARLFGQDFLKEAEGKLKAANGPEGDQGAADGQTDLEGAIAQKDAGIIRIGLSDFGPNATLEGMELEDLDLTMEQLDAAHHIEVFDADGRRNVLKSKDGQTGIAGEDFTESSAEELAAQKARPSTQKATDPAADQEG